MDLSVIVVNWNTCRVTCECLASLLAQCISRTFEVIVVDNGSSDGSVAAIRSRFEQVILIENRVNRGFAAANNQAMAVAKGRYFLLLNSDTLVLDSAIDKVVDFADAHPKAGIVGCRVLNADRSLQPSCSNLPTLLDKFMFAVGLPQMFPGSRFFGRERMLWWSHDAVRSVGAVSGCFMLVRREAVEEVGTLDEQFFMYCEEVDWCKRFHDRGWAIEFTPAAEIIHLGGVSAGHYGGRRARMIDRSYVRYMFKHWTALSAHAGVLAMAMFYLLRLVLCMPVRVCGRRRDVFDNHWRGLLGLLRFRHYLAE